MVRHRALAEKLLASVRNERAQSSEAMCRFREMVSEWRETPSSKPRRVLLVDDDETYRALLMDLLIGRFGCEVVAASAVDEALAAGPIDSYHLIVTDLRLHGETAREFIARLGPHHPHVLLISAFHADEVESIGADSFVSKTSPLDVIVAALSRALAAGAA